jgi:hypothetical protein
MALTASRSSSPNTWTEPPFCIYTKLIRSCTARFSLCVGTAGRLPDRQHFFINENYPGCWYLAPWGADGRGAGRLKGPPRGSGRQGRRSPYSIMQREKHERSVQYRRRSGFHSFGRGMGMFTAAVVQLSVPASRLATVLLRLVDRDGRRQAWHLYQRSEPVRSRVPRDPRPVQENGVFERRGHLCRQEPAND